MPKRDGRGGKREGAGRKPVHPEGATILVAVTVPALLMDRLDGMAEANGWNRSEAVTQAIRGFVAKPKRG
jgi:hypothetical protein